MTTDLSDYAIKAGDHVVQFYTNDLELVTKVGSYLVAAARAGETLVVIVGTAHRQAFESQINAACAGSSDAATGEQCLLLDAHDVMAQFIEGGRVARDRFHTFVGEIMRSAHDRGKPVRVYGEMVALLWKKGEVLSAIELETLWNELIDKSLFSLICAYPAGCLDELQHEEAVQQVCGLHSRVFRPSLDDGKDSTFQRTEVRSQFTADRDAPRAARHFVLDALRQLEYDEELVDDAALVSTELATNAVVHANSPFSVVLKTDGSIVRISVRDVGPLSVSTDGMKAKPGHGLGLIAALAHSWGIDVLSEGKTVWVELNAVRFTA